METTSSTTTTLGMDLLRGWLDAFTHGTATWGKVAATASDGSVCKRDGVIVTLYAPVTHWIAFNNTPGHDAERTKLREAIDLVHLALAAAPFAVSPILESKRTTTTQAFAYGDALGCIARGVPYALHVVCEYAHSDTHFLQHHFASAFMDNGAVSLSTQSEFQSVRQALVNSVETGCRARLQRIVTLPVRMTLKALLGATEAVEFFAGLTAFASVAPSPAAAAASSGWAIHTCHAPLVLHKIELDLLRVHVTSPITALTTALVNTGVPIECSRVVLDLRFISCTREELKVFLHHLTRGGTQEAPVMIHTASDLYKGDFHALDRQNENCSDGIDMLFTAIASIHSPIDVEISRLLRMCESHENHKAIFESLFGLVVLRDAQLTTIQFETCRLEEGDVVLLKEQAAACRLRNPGKLLAVQSLKLYSRQANAAFVDAVAAVLDDAVSVDAGAVSKDGLVAILNYPSLRRLSLIYPANTSLDLFDPSVPDPRVPTKPALEEL